MNSTLHVFNAIKNNKIIPLEQYLGNNHDVNAQNEAGYTLVHSATCHVNYQALKALLKAGADPSIANNVGETPLHSLSNIKTRTRSAQNRFFLCAKRLLNHDKTEVNARAKHLDTPLHYSVKASNSSLVSLLIQNKHINPNAKNEHGNTPLHCAFFEQNIYTIETVRLLLEPLKININEKNKQGVAPIHLAIDHGNILLINLFFKCEDLNVNTQDNNGITPLMSAIIKNNYEWFKKLYNDPRVKKYIKNKEGKNAYYLAVEHKRENIIKLFQNTI
jgi:ankyrin repeat protein